MQTRLSAEERDQMATLLKEGIGLAEIARRLGRPVSNLEGTRRVLARTGQIPRPERRPWRPWTGADLDELKRQIDLGYSYDRIARSMKRTRVAIMLKAKRIDQRLTHSNATLSAGAVAELLGKRCSKSVSYWIRRKWLKATNGRSGQMKRPLWRVRWEDLTAFMENPAYWLAWSPDQVGGDPAFQEWARELRTNEGRWLTQAEVARRYHVGRDTVKQWIAKGWLPAQRYGNHLIHERSLEGFVPPCNRPRSTWAYADMKDWPRDGWDEVGQTSGGTLLRRRMADS